MKVLVVNLCDLGDVLLASPLLDALAGRHEVHTLVDQSCAEATAGQPSVARNWVLPRRDWAQGLALESERPSVLAQALAWAEGLREQNFDTVYCLQAKPLPAALAGLAGGRQARGFAMKEGGIVAAEGAEVLARHLHSFENRADDGLHAAEGFLSMLPSGAWPEHARLSFAVSAKAEDAVSGILKGQGRCVAVLPGAGGAHKRWPMPAWIALLRGWRRLFPQDRVLALGGPSDAERGAVLARRVPGVEDHCGRLGLAESAAVMARCAAVVGGDTGPLHLAAAVGTPCLGLFGPTHPSESGPLLRGSLALQAGSGRIDDLEPMPVLRGLADLLAGRSAYGLRGAQTWSGREAEGARISAAWTAASMHGWLQRQPQFNHEDGGQPLKEWAGTLMERAERGLQRLDGPSLALVHSYVSLTFKVFAEENP